MTTSFETTWAAMEALHLQEPLKELGSFLRSQPGTGVDKTNLPENPSPMQLARLFYDIKAADPDLSRSLTGPEYDGKDFEF